MQQIKVGLVGYGIGGSIFHAPFIQAVPQFQLAKVMSRRREEIAKDLPGVEAVADLEAIINDASIDLVVLTTPTSTHFALAHQALMAGKHVLLDKPFVTNVAEADELVELANRRDLKLTVYQNRRWDGDFLTVRQLIEERQLGEVYHFESHFDRFRPKIKGGWRDESGPGSGMLYDLGAHLIDQALVLWGKPEAVTADVFAQRAGAESTDYFHLILHYGRHRAILHASTLSCQPGARFAIHGDEGSFVKFGLDPQEDALKAGQRPGQPGWDEDSEANYGELVLSDGTRRKVPTLVGGYEKFYQALAASLLEGAPVPVDPCDSRTGLRIIEAAYASAESCSTVKLG